MMRRLRPWIAATLCAAFLLFATPTSWGAPRDDGSLQATTTAWLDWFDSLLGRLLPWGSEQPKPTAGGEDNGLHSFAAAQGTDTPGLGVPTLSSSQSSNSDAGIVPDPDG